MRSCESSATSPKVNEDPQVQKALRRLAAEMAPTSLSQLVMWRLAGGLDWDTIAQLSREVGERLRADAGQGFRGASGCAAGG